MRRAPTPRPAETRCGGTPDMSSGVDRVRQSYPLAIRARPLRPRWLTYAAAIAAPALAAALNTTVPALHTTPTIAFGLAVLVATWFGGLGPSLVATAGSILLMQLVHTLDGTVDLRAGQVAFAVMGVLLGTVW